jgi:hypothetical protein
VTMDARFTHKSPIRDAPAAERIGDGGTSLSAKSAARADRACRCVAKPAVCVRMSSELPGAPPDVSSWIGAETKPQ